LSLLSTVEFVTHPQHETSFDSGIQLEYNKRFQLLQKQVKKATYVVVIPDSNMSLSVSSEDSLAVNADSGITPNEMVWIKEGDTTEDENSITINEE